MLTFLLISAPGNYSLYPAILTSFPFSATCTQKVKFSPGRIYGMFYITGQHFQHFVLGLKKQARQSPAWVSSLDEANKYHFVLTCATRAATKRGTGRSRQTHDLKARGWLGNWMSWGFTFSSCWYRDLHRGRFVSASVSLLWGGEHAAYSHHKAPNKGLPKLDTGLQCWTSNTPATLWLCSWKCSLTCSRSSNNTNQVIHTPGVRQGRQKGIKPQHTPFEDDP